MMATRRSWPVPLDLIEALPPRKEVMALPPKVSDPEKAKLLIDELAKELKR